MRWTEITVHVPAEHADAVGNVFYEAGSGIQVDEPASFRSGPVRIKAYLAQEGDYRAQLESIRRRITAIAGEAVRFELGEVENEDWAVTWREHYKPFRVGRRLLVKPTWEQVQAAPGDLVIELDPGMAFGCGTHPTTAACMEFLEKYLRPGMRVYDVGTGSGILSIAAALLGAGRVYAVDEDPMAVRVAGENIVQNGLADRIEVGLGDLLDRLDKPADLIVANIVAEVIIRLLPAARTRLVPGGILIVGGISSPKKDEVLQAMAAEGFKLIDSTEVKDWVALVGIRE